MNNRRVPRGPITFIFILVGLIFIAGFAFFISNMINMSNHLPLPFIIFSSLILLLIITIFITFIINFFRHKNKMFDRMDQSIRIREKFYDNLDKKMQDDINNKENDNVQEDVKKYCPYCGSQLNEEESKCPLCGK